MQRITEGWMACGNVMPHEYSIITRQQQAVKKEALTAALTFSHDLFASLEIAHKTNEHNENLSVGIRAPHLGKQFTVRFEIDFPMYNYGPRHFMPVTALRAVMKHRECAQM